MSGTPTHEHHADAGDGHDNDEDEGDGHEARSLRGLAANESTGVPADSFLRDRTTGESAAVLGAAESVVVDSVPVELRRAVGSQIAQGGEEGLVGLTELVADPARTRPLAEADDQVRQIALFGLPGPHFA